MCSPWKENLNQIPGFIFIYMCSSKKKTEKFTGLNKFYWSCAGVSVLIMKTELHVAV